VRKETWMKPVERFASAIKSSAGCVLMLAGCASSSPPMPPPALEIPPAPLTVAPESLPAWQPKAQSFLHEVERYFERVRSITTNAPPK
jgi:hypothetical protein